MKDIATDPELQAAFVHGMMFAFESGKAGLDVAAMGNRLTQMWAIGDVEKTAQQYGERIVAILSQRPI